jgi:hypothetical protein
MKLLTLIVFASLHLFAGCLAIDSLIVIPAACESGACATGPGVIGSAEVKAMLTPQFQVLGHNSCKAKQPIIKDGTGTNPALGAWSVEVAFYDKENFRIGIGVFYVGSLDPAEKFKHAYEIPDNVRVLGPVESIRVRSITQSVAIPGQRHQMQ